MEQYLNKVVRYIPMDRRQAMANGAVLGDRASGAVLFADISGFTPLTAALYQDLGPQRGAEELDHLLNLVFDALIGRVHNFHGSVIGFSGDAITCWFDGDNGLWATACALEMQEMVDQIGAIKLPDGSTLTMAIKVTVATGRVRRLVAGDPQIQRIDVVAGAAIDRAAAAEKVASRGDVIVTPEIRSALDGRALFAGEFADAEGQIFSAVAELTSPVEGRPWLDLPQNDLDQAQLQPWLLPTVFDLLNSGHGQFLAELRNIVALFLKFDGLDYDNDPAVGDKLDRYVCWVQGIVAHYGGALIHLTMGDKGSYLLVAFGTPVAHEDDPRRAVSAALDLISLPEALDFIKDVRIGVSQGIMFSGAYGGSGRRTFGIQGEETNIAARLMEKAEAGQVLVTSRVAAATRQSHRFQDLEPVTVKGVTEPVEVCRLLERRRTPQKRGAAQAVSEMVGRSEERRLLQEQIKTLQEGEGGGVIIVEGEAGIGKSRLLEDLLQQVVRLEITAYLGAGDAIEKNAAYHAWRSIFWDLFDLDAPAGAEPPGAGRLSAGQRAQVLDKVQTAVPDQAHLAPLLNAVLPIDLPENELTAQMNGEVRAGNTQDLLIALLNVQAEFTPLLLVLEDAHWLDSASWALTRLVSRDISPLLLVLATRPLPDPVPSEYSALVRRTNTKHIELNILAPQETLQLVCMRLGVDELPNEVIELLLEKAGGHPFFSEELAYALRDNGLLLIENRGSRLAAGAKELDTLSFPDSIDSVITSRIDLLTAQQQLTLKVASVIGRIFPFSTLNDIHPVASDRPQLHEQLNTLERLDITPLETPEPELSYIFKHIITQEVAYNLMSFAQRQGLHQAIGEWIEKTYGDDLSSFYPLLAYHYQKALGDQYGRADLGARAIEYLEKAAVQALNNFANREAIDFFSDLLALDEALGYPSSKLRRARWERGLGESFNRLGEWHKARQPLEAALTLLDHAVPKTNVTLLLGILIQLIRQLFYQLRPAVPSEAAVIKMSPEKHESVQDAIRAYSALVGLYYFTEERYLFLFAGLKNANLAQHLGASPELLAAYGNLCITMGNIPLHGLARSYGRRLLEMAEDIEDVPAKAWALYVTSYYYLYAGPLSESEKRATQSITFAAEIGYRRQWDDSNIINGLSMLHQARFAEARPFFASAVASAKRRDDAQPQVWGLVCQAEAGLWVGGDAEASLADLQEAKRLLAGTNININDHIRVHGLLAVNHLCMGNEQLARYEAQKTLDLAAQAGFLIPYAREGYQGAVDVFLTLWEKADDRNARQEYAELAGQGLVYSRRLGRIFPVIKPRDLLLQGRYDWLSGKHSKAHKAWRKSLELARELGMPHEEGLAEYEYGRLLPPGDPEREIYLNRALELFKQVEANYYITRTREELNSTA